MPDMALSEIVNKKMKDANISIHTVSSITGILAPRYLGEKSFSGLCRFSGEPYTLLRLPDLMKPARLGYAAITNEQALTSYHSLENQ